MFNISRHNYNCAYEYKKYFILSNQNLFHNAFFLNKYFSTTATMKLNIYIWKIIRERMNCLVGAKW